MDLVLLDTGATFSLVRNRALITGVTKAKDAICMRTNVGTRNLEEHGRFTGFDRPVWYDKNSMANIFSFAELAQQYRITYDSSEGDHFNIHGTSKGTIKFKKSNQGLYYYNFQKGNKNIQEEVQLVDTVAKNRRNYSIQQFERAKGARKLQNVLLGPTVKTLKMILRSNMVKNCNITEEDVDLAQAIFGPDISYVKGKTTRRKPVPVVNNTIQIPKELKYKHQ